MTRRLVRAAAAATWAVLAFSGVAAGANGPAGETGHLLPHADLAPGIKVELTHVRITPSAPRPHELLHIEGVARSQEVIEGKYLTLRVMRNPIITREELHAAATDNERLETATEKIRPTVGNVVPGVDTRWSIDIPIDDLHLSTLGVYRLSVEYVDADFFPRGRVNTFLPYFPTGGWQPTNVAWVWPLVDAPRRTASAPPPSPRQPTATEVAPNAADGTTPVGVSASSGETFLDDTLASSMAPDGRLGALVTGAANAAKQHGFVRPVLPPATAAPTAGVPTTVKLGAKAPVIEPLPRRPVPVTWAIDPDLLESAHSMAGGYVVQDNGETHRGSAASMQTAAQWLTAVTSAVGDSPVIPLPYADADLVALARAGRDDEASRALRPGGDAESIFRTVLSRRAQVAPSIVWPVGGTLTHDALDMLARLQVSAVVLSAAALPVRNPSERASTPGMQGPSLPAGGGTVQPLVSDQTLDGLIAEDPSLDNRGLAEQRFLAETAMITAEAPNRTRDILLLPPRHATNTDYLSFLLALTGRVPWLNGITVDDALRHGTDPTERGPLTYPEADKAAEVSRAVIDASYATVGRLDMLKSILNAPEVLAPTDRGLLRTYSASWRKDRHMADTVRANTLRTVEDWIAKVSVVTSNQSLTLLSKSAKIPLTITNGLDQGVHGIRVRLRADNIAYMDEAQADDVGIYPHDRHPLFLAANIRAVGSLRFGVKVLLLTHDGQILSKVQLQVHSTGSGGTVLLVTLILLGLLYAVVTFRLIRRAWKYYAARRAVA